MPRKRSLGLRRLVGDVNTLFMSIAVVAGVALAILALLVARGGRTDFTAPAVELSLFDVMTDVMGYALTYTQHSGIDQQPLGVSSPAVAPYGAFPTRDG